MPMAAERRRGNLGSSAFAGSAARAAAGHDGHGRVARPAAGGAQRVAARGRLGRGGGRLAVRRGGGGLALRRVVSVPSPWSRSPTPWPRWTVDRWWRACAGSRSAVVSVVLACAVARQHDGDADAGVAVLVGVGEVHHDRVAHGDGVAGVHLRRGGGALGGLGAADRQEAELPRAGESHHDGDQLLLVLLGLAAFFLGALLLLRHRSGLSCLPLGGWRWTRPAHRLA